MQIIRVGTDVRKSIITGINVDNVNGLPKASRERMIKLLNMLKDVKRINIKDKADDAIFEFSDVNVTLDFFNQKIRKEFIEIIDLLQWYERPHWSSREGVYGAPLCCTHCGYAKPSGSPDDCPSPGCPSHEKWRQIIGPSYKIPGDFSPDEKKRLIKAFKAAEKLKMS